MINELDLFWLPNFLAVGIYFICGTKFSWNKGIDTCFNVECVLLGRNFDFLGGYCSLPSGYCLLFGGYCSFPILAWTQKTDIRTLFQSMEKHRFCFEMIYQYFQQNR